MKQFYQIHNELVSSVDSTIKRELKNEINWNNRLIGIKGARGIGKTVFLLDYIKSAYGNDDKSCLYINLNNFYFSKYGLVEFADEFQKMGGKTLVIDQVFKFPGWSKALRNIYDRFPNLQVIFTGSPVMRLKQENTDLFDKVTPYHLRGLSFREYLNYKTSQSFAKYTIEDILNYHEKIAKDILFKVKPLAYFNDYLKVGFYPFSDEATNFNETVTKIANLTLEIDIPFLQQIELKYLPKLKKLMYELSEDMPNTPNVSKLSNSIETSRATVMNYLNYLRNARLINLVYEGEADASKKPERIYLQNTNLIYAISHTEPTREALLETFFLNMMNKDFKVSGIGKKGEFLIDDNIIFKVGNNKRLTGDSDNTYIVTDMHEVGTGNKIPLWLFGFLY